MPGSLDDISSDSSVDWDEEERLAQLEWEENIQQLHQIFNMVLIPALGKFLGRSWSYWAYKRYLRLGLGSAFIFGK